jgi:nitric oxide dioxygenase
VFDAALSAQLAASVAEASVLTTVQAIIVGLRRPDRILEPAQKLAIKALDYGALSQNMTFVGNALLRTLKRRLGEDYTPEVRDAWIGAYRLVADAMRDAALGRGWRRAA